MQMLLGSSVCITYLTPSNHLHFQVTYDMYLMSLITGSQITVHWISGQYKYIEMDEYLFISNIKPS